MIKIYLMGENLNIQPADCGIQKKQRDTEAPRCSVYLYPFGL